MDIEEISKEFNLLVEQLSSAPMFDTRTQEEINLEIEIKRFKSKEFRHSLLIYSEGKEQELETDLQLRVEKMEEDLEELKASNLSEENDEYYKGLHDKIHTLNSSIIQLYSGEAGKHEAERQKESIIEIVNDSDVASHLNSQGIDPEKIYKFVTSIPSILDYYLSFEFRQTLPIEVFNTINDELVRILLAEPQKMYKISPRLFEELIAKLMEKYGMTVELTQRTRDGGKDIIAIHETGVLTNKYFIECKRYAPDNKVGIDLIQRMIGINHSAGITKSFIVTTSSYSSDAIAYAKPHHWTLELKAYDDIVEWLKNYFKD